MARKTRSKGMRNKKSNRRHSRKMRGGQLNEQELMTLGFTAEQINTLHEFNIDNMNLIRMSLQQTNPQTGNPFTPQELIDSLNEANNEIANLDEEDNVSNGVNPPAMDMEMEMDINVNNNFQPGPALNMEDLEPESPRSVVDFPQGGRRKRRTRSRKMRKMRRMRSRNRKTYKGGACYGNGVGANAFDPNNSIFNTRELQLFPYRPY